MFGQDRETDQEQEESQASSPHQRHRWWVGVSSSPRLLVVAVVLAVFVPIGLVFAASLFEHNSGERGVTPPPVTEPTSSPDEATSRAAERTSGEKIASGHTTRQPPERREAAQSEDARSEERANTGTLEARIRSIAGRYPGTYGVAVWQPGSGERASLNADRRFPSASLAKLPVLLALYREAAAGRVDLDEQIRLRPADITGGTGVLQHRPPGHTLTLRECAHHLISDSDNTAWAMLERYLGEPRVRAELESVGTTSTNYEYAQNATTPNDMVEVLERISDPEYISPALSEEMLSFMTGTSFEDRLPRGVPPDARVAHKIGILADSFGDAGVVYPQGEKEDIYYVVVLSDDTTEEASRTAMQEISRTAYRSLVEAEATPRSERL